MCVGWCCHVAMSKKINLLHCPQFCERDNYLMCLLVQLPYICVCCSNRHKNCDVKSLLSIKIISTHTVVETVDKKRTKIASQAFGFCFMRYKHWTRGIEPWERKLEVLWTGRANGTYWTGRVHVICVHSIWWFDYRWYAKQGKRKMQAWKIQKRR